MDRATLSQALASVGAQSYPAIELLVVAASKASHAPVPDAAGPFSITLHPPRAEGLSRSIAANVGLEMASGAFALFLDDDDWIEPQHIEKLVKQLESEGASNAIACYSATRCVDLEGHPRPEVFRTPYDPIRLLVGNFIPIHACLFRLTPKTRLCQLDPNLPLYEDWDFWMQLSEIGSFLQIEAETAVYRLGSGSGFGVDGWGSPSARSAYRQVLNKWRTRWSLDELESIIERARISFENREEGRPLLWVDPHRTYWSPPLKTWATSLWARIQGLWTPS